MHPPTSPSFPALAAFQRALLGILLALASACGEPFPRDPGDTTRRVQSSGVMRVGVTEHPPWVERGPDGAAAGLEVRLVLELARRNGARVEWTWGQLEALFAGLLERELDLVVGGIDADSPWKERIGLTEPWRTRSEGSGVPSTSLQRARYPSQVVLAVPAGENRWLGEVDRAAHQFALDLAQSNAGQKP